MEPPYVIYHDNVGSHMNVRPVDVGDDSPPGEEHKEEILVDKHIVSVENAAGEILSVCSDDSSESFEWSHHGLELRRLERRMSKEVVITMREPPWRSMDDMRNEEFTFSMEAFIAERNEVMMEENIHDEEGLPFF
ncbi:hypothetical protein QQP08_022289 [Theobroma cacao]|nr:hypothetical protein QQP08_022289 [Theobroma cacao]